MNKRKGTFEETLIQALEMEDADQTFVDHLGTQLKEKYRGYSPDPRRIRKLKPAMAFLLGIVLFLIGSVIWIGPQRVYAEVLRLLGYIPGIGIVDQRSSTRILAQPVRITRDGITVSLNQIISTENETKVSLGVSGVPLQAYRSEEGISACNGEAFFQLEDGSIIDQEDIIPDNENDLTLILPCIFNTLPGSVPENWLIPFELTPLPEETEILPVISLSPDEKEYPQKDELQDQTPQELEVTEVIQNGQEVILIGWFRPVLEQTQRMNLPFMEYLDAAGNPVSVETPQDIDLSFDGDELNAFSSRWAIKYDQSGVQYPLTIRYWTPLLERVEGQESIELTIDTGSDPQEGQIWNVDQEFMIGSYILSIDTIEVTTRGYKLNFTTDQEMDFLVEIEGYQAVGGGGGPNTRSFEYDRLPAGELKFIFSDFYGSSGFKEWTTTFTPPDGSQTGGLINDSTPMCEIPQSLESLPDAVERFDGWVLTAQNDPINRLQLTEIRSRIIQLDIPDTHIGDLSSDGSRIAYVTEEGVVVADSDGNRPLTLAQTGGHDVIWSPDRRFLTFVNPPTRYGIHLTHADGTASYILQVTEQGSEAVAGWSPDSSMIYFTVPDAGDQGFMLRGVNIQTNIVHNMFILENSSQKAPFAAVSPDGRWVAYRDRDNSSVYLKAMDGSKARLLLDKPAAAISALAWNHDSSLLGVSIVNPEEMHDQILIVDVNTCEMYYLDGIFGRLEDINLIQVQH